MTVSAVDAHGNAITGCAGKVHFTGPSGGGGVGTVAGGGTAAGGSAGGGKKVP